MFAALAGTFGIGRRAVLGGAGNRPRWLERCSRRLRDWRRCNRAGRKRSPGTGPEPRGCGPAFALRAGAGAAQVPVASNRAPAWVAGVPARQPQLAVEERAVPVEPPAPHRPGVRDRPRQEPSRARVWVGCPRAGTPRPSRMATPAPGAMAPPPRLRRALLPRRAPAATAWWPDHAPACRPWLNPNVARGRSAEPTQRHTHPWPGRPVATRATPSPGTTAGTNAARASHAVVPALPSTTRGPHLPG